MGFGFVEYRRPEQAQKALKQLQVRGFSGGAPKVAWRVVGRGPVSPPVRSGSPGEATLALALEGTVARGKPRSFLSTPQPR